MFVAAAKGDADADTCAIRSVAQVAGDGKGTANGAGISKMPNHVRKRFGATTIGS